MLKNKEIWSNISSSFKENITKRMDFIEIDDDDKFIHLKKICSDDIIFEENKLLQADTKPLYYYRHRMNNIILNKVKALSIDNTKYTKSELLTKENNGEIFRISILKTIINQFKLEKGLYKEKLNLHIKILQCLKDSLDSRLYFSNTNDTINLLVLNAIYLYWTSTYHNTDQYIQDEIPLIIDSVEKLKLLNLKYTIEIGNIVLKETEDIKVHKKLEELICSVGGLEILKKLFQLELCPKYNKELKRYIINRNKNSMGKIPHERIPYNYLIQLCVKNIKPKKNLFTSNNHRVSNANYIYNQIIDISKNYMTILNLQGYSIFEDFNNDIDAFPEYIYKNILFETLYIPAQYENNFVIDILETLYKCFLKNFKENIGYRFQDYITVTKFILKERNILKIFTFEDIKSGTNLKSEKLKRILEDISNYYTQINIDFNAPFKKTNFSEKPLIKLDDNHYFLLSSEICAYSFCTALQSILNIPNKQLGDKVEDLVKKYLTRNSINFKCGKYFPNSQLINDNELECDLILENEKFIVFIEIKKRGLPQEFETGNDIEVFKALSEGMITAQKQILKHKFHLIEEGQLKLYNSPSKDNYQILEYKNRKIISISLCLSEYGFITNKTFSSKFLNSLLCADYKAVDENEQPKLNKLNKLSEDIRTIVNQLKILNPNMQDDSIFFSSLFMSIQQFIYIIKMCSNKNIDLLISSINRLIYLLTPSLDIYSDILDIYLNIYDMI